MNFLEVRMKYIRALPLLTQSPRMRELQKAGLARCFFGDLKSVISMAISNMMIKSW